MAALQRLRRAIMDENGGGGAGRFVGAFDGRSCQADITAVACDPDWQSGPRCIEVPFFVALRNEVARIAALQRLRRAIMDENGGGAGRFIGAFATGDRAEADKTAVAYDPV